MRTRKLISLAALLSIAVSPASAQLRPLEPIQWQLFQGSATFSAELGASRLDDQRASLAGEQGSLWEIANFSAAYRTGRVVIEAAGTGQRIFTAHERFEDPYEDVEPSNDGRRHDSGDYRISTTIRFTPDRSPVTGAVRFGTRLPTTDNTTGLDRDAIDFFATIGAASARGPVTLAGEAGLGIHTTRERTFEQDDLLLYALRAEWNAGPVVPSIAAIGQAHGTGHSAIRGVENLGELRAGLRLGDRRWVRAELVKGYETFSPSFGVIVAAGFVR
jgi:hypothetical protein